MKYLLIIGILFTFSPPPGYTQLVQKGSIQVAYYGDILVHPGLQIGTEKPFRTWETNRKKKKYKSLNTGADFIYYFHKGNHHGLTLAPHISYRRTKENGKFFQVKLNLGYHRSFVAGTTYTVDEAANVKEVNLAGQNTLYNNLSLGFGKDLRLTKNKPIRYFWAIGINGRYPYNHAFLAGINLQLGIHYFLKD